MHQYIKIAKGAVVGLTFFFVCGPEFATNAVAQDNMFSSSYNAVAEFFGNITASNKRRQIVRLKYNGLPFTLHIAPNQRAAITARLQPATRYVKIYRGCRGNWCNVQVGSAAGWLRKDRILVSSATHNQPEYLADRPELDVEREAPPEVKPDPPIRQVSIPLPSRKVGVPPVRRPVSTKREPAVAIAPPENPRIQPRIQEVAVAKPEILVEKPEVTITTPVKIERKETPLAVTLKVYDIPRKQYRLTRVDNLTFLPVREDRSDDARILGGIPFFSDKVEALGVCVNDWCLVKYGDNLRGWIREHHLSDDKPQQTQPLLKVQDVSERKTIPLYSAADEASPVAAYISTQSDNIQPAGNCDFYWCHIRHESGEGWIQSQYLAKQQ
ncbi:MAG: hypothetical protein KTR19_03250 [Hyphomicrobiales bacterium]|nr:hypothetical protein [Hyphomicrobiales bacterium]